MLEICFWLLVSLLVLDDFFVLLCVNCGELWINGEVSGFYLFCEVLLLVWNDDGWVLVL